MGCLFVSSSLRLFFSSSRLLNFTSSLLVFLSSTKSVSTPTATVTATGCSHSRTAESHTSIQQPPAVPSMPEDDGLRMPPVPPDGGYGWVIVIAAFFISVIVGGNCFSFGVFYPVYIDEFNGSQGTVAWIGSIAACLVVGPGPITGACADRFNNQYTILAGAFCVGAAYALASLSTALWHLYLTQGFLAGLGFSLCFMSGISAVGQWFSVNRGLAQGIMVAGSGIGQLVVSMIANALIEKGGWRFALRILAVINLSVLIICSFVVKRWLPCTTHFSLITAWDKFQDANFNYLFLGTFIHSLGTYMPFTHLTVYALNHGMTKSQAVLILSFVGIANAVGRIITGWLADRVGKVFMFQISMFGSGVSTLCWMTCTTFPSLFAYGLIYGFFAGGVISLIPSVTSALFGVNKIGAVTGLLYSSTAVGNLLAAPIGGFLHDAYHSYYPPISVAGGFLLFGMVFIYFIHQDAPTRSKLDTVEDNEGKDCEYSNIDKESGKEVIDEMEVTVSRL